MDVSKRSLYDQAVERFDKGVADKTIDGAQKKPSMSWFLCQFMPQRPFSVAAERFTGKCGKGWVAGWTLSRQHYNLSPSLHATHRALQSEAQGAEPQLAPRPSRHGLGCTAPPR